MWLYRFMTYLYIIDTPNPDKSHEDMALSIKNTEVDRLARELSEVTGESLTEAISSALKERLERETGKKQPNRLHEEIRRIQERVGRLPRLDERSDEEIIGYNNQGLMD